MQLQDSFTPSTYSSVQPTLGVSGVFPIQRQIMGNWCWAACTFAICQIHHLPVPDQYHIVADLTKIPRCSFPPPVASCNVQMDLAIALAYYGRLNREQDGALSDQDTLSYVENGQAPVACQLFLPNIGGHAVIIYNGYRAASGQLVLNVADPADGALLTMTYDQIRHNYRNTGGGWTRTYITH